MHSNDKQFDGHHEHSHAEGYKPAKYEHQEYPKVVGVEPAKDGKPAREIVVANADEEQAYLEGDKSE